MCMPIRNIKIVGVALSAGGRQISRVCWWTSFHEPLRNILPNSARLKHYDYTLPASSHDTTSPLALACAWQSLPIACATSHYRRLSTLPLRLTSPLPRLFPLTWPLS